MKKSIKIVFWLMLNIMTWPGFAATLAAPGNLIAYNSPTGQDLLFRSAHHKYLQLSMQFLK